MPHADFFEIIGPVTDVETIAKGSGVKARDALRRKYGGNAWSKKKGHAKVRLKDSGVRHAEIHWYEAHGVGRKDFKIKRFLD